MKENEVFPDRINRTTYETLSMILENCKQPKNPAQLFYALKTSYSLLRSHLEEASHLKLLQETRKGYVLTPKGAEYLVRWEGFLKFLKESS